MNNICNKYLCAEDASKDFEVKLKSQIHLFFIHFIDKTLTHNVTSSERSNTKQKRNNHFNVYKFDLFIDTVKFLLFLFVYKVIL